MKRCNYNCIRVISKAQSVKRVGHIESSFRWGPWKTITSRRKLVMKYSKLVQFSSPVEGMDPAMSPPSDETFLIFWIRFPLRQPYQEVRGLCRKSRKKTRKKQEKKNKKKSAAYGSGKRHHNAAETDTLKQTRRNCKQITRPYLSATRKSLVRLYRTSAR